jgi:putative flippase GtrA
VTGITSASSASFAVRTTNRVGKFIAVGWLGFILQLTLLAVLMSVAHWTWLPATIVAVELTVIHNFFWHERTTWRDRVAALEDAGRGHLIDALERFLRFNGATGLTSILGNALLMAIYVGPLGLPALLANALAVGTMSVVNFIVSDRWVFRAGGPGGRRLRPHRPSDPSAGSGSSRAESSDDKLRVVPSQVEGRAGDEPVEKSRAGRAGVVPALLKKNLAAAVIVVGVLSTVASAAPSSATVAAWDRYVAQTEKRLDPARRTAAGSPSVIEAEGSSIGVEGGTVSDWRGAVFIPNVTLDEVLTRLQYPGTAPPQDDVLSSHVISRRPGSLRVSVRIVRHAIVTVTYDTEHEMTFTRRTPTVATARSVATRIEEVGDGDRGFLWRLHSYWRYEQVDGGVWVELQSLTLSRTVPALVRPIASPVVSRIARESTVRTLEALRRYLQRA